MIFCPSCSITSSFQLSAPAVGKAMQALRLMAHAAVETGRIIVVPNWGMKFMLLALSLYG
jgi:hypothetical protein